MFQLRSFQALLNLMQDEVRLYESDIDLRAEIVRKVKLLAPFARQRDLQVELVGLESLPHRIHGDPVLVGQLIYFMLDNALKYAHPDPSGSTILVDASSSDPTRAVLRIVNRGILIASDEVAHIFEMGYRGRGARTVALGAGRGLFLAKRIADLHGGDIQYRSDERSGLNIFVITLLVRRGNRA